MLKKSGDDSKRPGPIYNSCIVPKSEQLQRLLVPADAAGQRVDQWLAAQLPDASRVRVQQLMEQDKVTVNGARVKPATKLRGGEEIVISGQVELPPLKAFAEDIPLDVVYEDNDLAVINKPAGMTVHAGSGKGQASRPGDAGQRAAASLR